MTLIASPPTVLVILPTPVRPPAGGRVAVTFPETTATDAETVTGTVVSADHDSIDIVRDDDGETFTLFDSELARGKAILEVTG